MEAVSPDWTAFDTPARNHAIADLTRALSGAHPRLNPRFMDVNDGTPGLNRHVTLHAAPSSAELARLTLAGKPRGLAFVDGLTPVLAQPAPYLDFLFANTHPGAQIELLARPEETCTDGQLQQFIRQAQQAGFGLRHGPNPQSACVSLGLIRLAGPQQDFPVEGRESESILAPCQARLDIACRLVKGCAVLDAGGGTAIGARRFLAAGAASVVSLDVSEDALAHAHTMPADDRLRLVHWDMNAVPFPLEDDAFDVILCLEALEHTGNHAGIIAEFRRLLKPGGLLLISVPDLEFETVSARLNRCQNPHHVKVPARAELESLLAGFSETTWFRQADVVGSLITAESNADTITAMGSSLLDGSQLMRRPEVILALTRKPAGLSLLRAACADLSISDFRSRESPLRLHSSAAEGLIPARLRAEELELELLRDRFALWTRINEQRDLIEKLEARPQPPAPSLPTQALADLRRAVERLLQAQSDLVQREIAGCSQKLAQQQQQTLAETQRQILEAARVFGLIAERAEERAMRLEARVYDLEDRLSDLNGGGASAARLEESV